MADIPFRDVPQSFIDEVDKVCRPKAGSKHDAGKLRWHLMPWAQIESVAEVMEHGAKKYGERNWMEVDNGYERYFDAAMRHIMAEEEKPGSRDVESGQPHLAHAVCCLLFMMHFEGP
jgi:hypothetical protein